MIYLIFTITITLLAYLGVLIFLKNPKRRDNRNFLVSVFLSLGWLILNFFENIENFGIARIFFLKVDFILAPIVAYSWLILFIDFLEDKINKKTTKIILFIPLIFSPFLFTKGFIIKNIDYSSQIIQFEFGNYFLLYVFLVLVYFILANYVLFSKIKRFQGVKREQTKMILIGFFISSFLLTIINLFFQNQLNLLWFRLSSFSIIFLIIFTAYSISKYHLFDIKKIIERGAIYVGSFSLIIVVYILSVLFFGIFIGSNTKLSVHFGAFVTLILGIYGVPRLEIFFQKITDKIFYKDKYNFSEALNSLGEILNKNIKLESLVKSFSLRLNQILKTKKIIVVLLDEELILDEKGILRKITSETNMSKIKAINNIGEAAMSINEVKEMINKIDNKKTIKNIVYSLKAIKEFDINFFVKIIANKKLIGYILLGEKKSGDLFTIEDKTLLHTLSMQAGVAIEKARLYKKVQDYSKNLEKKVKERTAKIEGMQREQKQMMLEIAHRLQTPLTVVKGDLSVMMKGNKNNKKFVKFENSINKLSKFIYDILKLARLENNENDIKMENIDLSSLVKDLGEYFEVVMEGKKIKFDMSIDEDIIIWGNNDKIEELITNLVSNSVKYIGTKNNKKINIELARRKGRKAFLKISDNGIGIEKNEQANLFTRFYRSKNVNNTQVEGTGLGLVISKKIADVHNIKIKLDSEINKGTNITLEFRLL